MSALPTLHATRSRPRVGSATTGVDDGAVERAARHRHASRLRRAGSASTRCSPRSSRLFGWVAGTARLSDNSFFWHLRTGEYILDHGRVPHHDVFSFTAPGAKWVAQSWLAELAYGALEPVVRRVRGTPVRGAHRRRGRRARVPARVAAVPQPAARRSVSPRRRSRACSRCGRSARSCSAWCSSWCCSGSSKCPTRSPAVTRWSSIPLTLWLWANVHGSFALGFRVPRAAPDRPMGRRFAAVDAAVSARSPSRPPIGFVATFVNPYGRVARDLPGQSPVARRDPVARHRVAVARLPREVGYRARAVDLRVRRRGGARQPPGQPARPHRHRADAAARAVGVAQRRGRAARSVSRSWRARSPSTGPTWTAARHGRTFIVAATGAIVFVGSWWASRPRGSRTSPSTPTRSLDAVPRRQRPARQPAVHRRRRRRLRDPAVRARAACVHGRPLRHVPGLGDQRLLHGVGGAGGLEPSARQARHRGRRLAAQPCARRRSSRSRPTGTRSTATRATPCGCANPSEHRPQPSQDPGVTRRSDGCPSPRSFGSSRRRGVPTRRSCGAPAAQCRRADPSVDEPGASGVSRRAPTRQNAPADPRIADSASGGP